MEKLAHCLITIYVKNENKGTFAVKNKYAISKKESDSIYKKFNATEFTVVHSTRSHTYHSK